MSKWILQFSTGVFLSSALIMFFVYHVAFELSISKLVVPWVVSLVATLCFSPAFYWGRARIRTSHTTKPFYLVCGTYLMVMLMLFTYYALRFGLISPNRSGFYYLGVVLLVPGIMVAAYYGNKLMSRRGE